MKKIIIYSPNLVEIKEIKNHEISQMQEKLSRTPNSGNKRINKGTKSISNNLSKSMKKNKELLFANASAAISTGIVFFVTGVSKDGKSISHNEFERRLKEYLQRLRRLSKQSLNYMLVKEFGAIVGYHFHLFLWAYELQIPLTEKEICSSWSYGDIKYEIIPTINDLLKVGNYCFNYSTKYNPESKEKIKRKIKGLEHFDINESLVKKSSNLKNPATYSLSNDVEIGENFLLLSHSERNMGKDKIWSSSFYEFCKNGADKSENIRYNVDELQPSRKEESSNG